MTEKHSDSQDRKARFQNTQEGSTRILKVFDEHDISVVRTLFVISAVIGFTVSIFWGLISGVIAIFGILVVLLNESLQSENEAIPPFSFGVPTRMGGAPIPRIVPSGRHFLFPYIDRIEQKYIFSYKPQALKVSVPITTSGQDKKLLEESSALGKAQKQLLEKSQELVINLDVTVMFAVDPRIKNNGIPAFALMADEDSTATDAFVEGLRSKVQSEFGRLGGLHIYTVFINRRREMENYLSSILRLTMPPHVDPLKMLDGFIEDNEETRERLEKLGWSEDSTEISMEHRLEFYEEFSDSIGELLRSEHDAVDHSTVELMYGVDLIESMITDVDYDEASRQAIQKEMQTIKELEGRAHYKAQLTSLMETLQEERGLSPADASATAQVILGLSESKTFNVSGIPDDIGSLLGGN